MATSDQDAFALRGERLHFSDGGARLVFALLGTMLLAVVVIHGWWLPKKGINGWTAEPREKYYALRGWKLKE